MKMFVLNYHYRSTANVFPFLSWFHLDINLKLV